jgi:hypothetical protein
MREQDVLLLDVDDANARIIAIWPSFCLKHVPNAEEPNLEDARPVYWEFMLAGMACVHAARVRELVDRLVNIGAISWNGHVDSNADKYVLFKAKRKLGL